MLDNQVITAPTIQQPITGGSGQISGNFTPQTANDLAVLLRAGALPATLDVVEERSVGASLGADFDPVPASPPVSSPAILVVAFMVVAYGLFGLFADISLVLNIVLIFASLSLLGSTLTLPGIAGIVLTIGMAVDANVLIYERIREELKAGKSILAAIDAGFKRAWGTIIDSHLTQLIAAIVLYFLGSGPVQGFAVTLALGILTSLFTAYTVTLYFVGWWYRMRAVRRRSRSRCFRFIPDGTKIPFMRISRYAIIFSIIISDRRHRLGLHQGLQPRHRLQGRLGDRDPVHRRRRRPIRPRSAKRSTSSSWAKSRCRASARPRTCWSASSCSRAASRAAGGGRQGQRRRWRRDRLRHPPHRDRRSARCRAN